MRYYSLALIGALLTGSAGLAQQPPAGAPQPPPAPAPGGAARLDFLLQRWEQEMKGVQTLVAQCNRTELNNVNMTTDVFVGTAKYLRPNLAMLDMQKKSDPQNYEKYICTGTLLYNYRPKSKTVQVIELPPPKPGAEGVGDDGFLSFLFGMKAEEAKRRYDLKLVKEDQWWVYLEVVPKLQADKQDFQKARLVLSASTFLPRELWFLQPNGNEVKWDMPDIRGNVQLNRNDFNPPATPPGWNVQRVPRSETPPAPPRTNLPPSDPPRIVRQQQ
jgi:TIGR03009 family protein